MHCLNQLEKLAQNSLIDIYYGDETQINEEGYIPYGWQFPDEKVSTPVQKGISINCLGFITRDNRFFYKTTQKKIDANFVLEQIEHFSWTISKPTVLVIDNAPVYKAKKIKERIPFWTERVGSPMRTNNFLFTYLFTPIEHCRNRLESVEILLAQTERL